MAVLTTNMRLAGAPGNLLLEAGAAGLTQDSVVNVSSLATIDKQALQHKTGRLTAAQLHAVDRGIRLALSV